MDYQLTVQSVNDADEPTGPVHVLATVKGGKVTGVMAATVERVVDIGEVQIGLTGGYAPCTHDHPWAVAYAVRRRYAALQATGIPSPGVVVAVTDAGEVHMPARWTADLVDDLAEEPTVADDVPHTPHPDTPTDPTE